MHAHAACRRTDAGIFTGTTPAHDESMSPRKPTAALYGNTDPHLYNLVVLRGCVDRVTFGYLRDAMTLDAAGDTAVPPGTFIRCEPRGRDARTPRRQQRVCLSVARHEHSINLYILSGQQRRHL